MNSDQRSYLERSLAAECSQRHQTPAEHAAWLGMGYTARILCHYDKVFAVWAQTDKGPNILGKFRVSAVDCCTRDGFGVSIQSDVRKNPEDFVWVSHNPARLFGLPVFAHVPFTPELTYTPDSRHPEKFTLRFPVVFKTASNPHMPVNGDIYVTQIGEFRNLYPEFADLKL